VLRLDIQLSYRLEIMLIERWALNQWLDLWSVHVALSTPNV